MINQKSHNEIEFYDLFTKKDLFYSSKLILRIWSIERIESSAEISLKKNTKYGKKEF